MAPKILQLYLKTRRIAEIIGAQREKCINNIFYYHRTWFIGDIVTVFFSRKNVGDVCGLEFVQNRIVWCQVDEETTATITNAFLIAPFQLQESDKR